LTCNALSTCLDCSAVSFAVLYTSSFSMSRLLRLHSFLQPDRSLLLSSSHLRHPAIISNTGPASLTLRILFLWSSPPLHLSTLSRAGISRLISLPPRACKIHRTPLDRQFVSPNPFPDGDLAVPFPPLSISRTCHVLPGNNIQISNSKNTHSPDATSAITREELLHWHFRRQVWNSTVALFMLSSTVNLRPHLKKSASIKSSSLPLPPLLTETICRWSMSYNTSARFSSSPPSPSASWSR
jgi:hypothetical protein